MIEFSYTNLCTIISSEKKNINEVEVSQTVEGSKKKLVMFIISFYKLVKRFILNSTGNGKTLSTGKPSSQKLREFGLPVESPRTMKTNFRK